MASTPAQHDNSSQRRHMLDAVVAFAVRVASAGLVFVLQVVLARLMDLGEYGSYITAWTWLVMLGAFVPLGFAESAVRFIPRYRARGRHGSALAFCRFGIRTVLLTSLLIAGFATILALGGRFDQDRVGLIMLIVAAGLPFLAVQNFLEGVARAHGWYRLTSIPIYIVRPVLIMAGCAAIVWYGAPLDLLSVGGAVVSAMLLVTLFLAVAVHRAVGREPQPVSPDDVTGSRRVWFRASAPLMLVAGMEDLLIYTDVLVLGALLEPDQVSIYFAAARALALANFVYYAFYFVSARGFSISNALADRDKLQQAVWATTRATFWFTALAVAATLVAGPWLLAAFGEGFAGGYGVMWILGAGLVIRGLAGQSAELLITTGRQRDILIAGGTAVVFNVALSVLLVPRLGIEGAAIATTFAMAAPSIHRWSHCHHLCDGRARAHAVPRGTQFAAPFSRFADFPVAALLDQQLTCRPASSPHAAMPPCRHADMPPASAGACLAGCDRGLNPLYQRGTERHAVEGFQSRQVGHYRGPGARRRHKRGLGDGFHQPAGLGSETGRYDSGHLAVKLADPFGKSMQFIAALYRPHA